MIPRLTVTTLATVAVLVAGLGAGAARAGAQATPGHPLPDRSPRSSGG
jgi:hypothetical protein